MSAYRTWRGLAAAAALVAAACRDSTAPQLSNPQQLSSDLQSVADIFATPVFQSFGVLGSAPGSPVASTPAAALLSAARIAAPQTPKQPYADAPARLQALRSAGSALSSRVSAQVIPSTLWGKTFVWDVSTHQYAEDANQFDANRPGVRIVLYAVDPITEQIVESPLTPVGYVDLLDGSSGTTNQLHVIVTSGTPASPGTTYANYTVSGAVTLNGSNQPTAFQAAAVGYLSNGTRRLDFNASFSATNLDTDNPDAQVDVHWALDNPAVTVDLHETLATTDANHATLTIDFSVSHGEETVRLAGTVVVDVLLQTVTADLTVYIKVSGQAEQVFARITGTNGGIQIRHVDGSELSQEELQAMAKLFELPDHIHDAIGHLFDPCEHLMGA